MGWTYNTPDDAANDGPHITAVAIIFTALSLSILSLRFYVRGWMIKAIGADDWILIATWIASCGFAVVTIVQTKWGLGLKHLDDMPIQNLYNFGLTNLCQPAAKQWDPSITWGQCLPAVPFYTSMASLTIVFDVVVMFLPFPVLLKSHIQKRKKFALLGLLALGTFITIIQVLRIRTVRNLANYLDSGSLIMWSTVENNLGIIVASIPTLAPLFKYFVEKTQKSSNGNSATRSRSMYGLKSRRTTRQGSIPLGSGVHQATHVSGPFEGGSEEFIMGDIAAITKKTEVTVSSRVREESDRSGK
ncbi:hypothetical protein AA0113_g9048 [Alternaria arborescens]|uniref:Rhodopsin domain-containing protein n=1 Tax=Alternaria arborescens TaxID=156630 RepID=A0A4Q4RF86_9PLEO|nr:hypothetical protein AA0113_g9048 [Alternaria arborescens]